MNKLTVIEKNINTSINEELFAKRYFSMRKKEGRIYTDEEVAMLPFIHTSHIHYREWLTRKNSLKALINYIKEHDTITNILETGCGNGWLSARLAQAVDVKVTGMDINVHELEQAKRVFKKTPDLNFIQGSLQSQSLQDKKFDLIIFAASIQYFHSLGDVVNDALEKLTMFGEIHIVDSLFYSLPETDAARQRTKDYYASIGFPEMANHYFHHSLSDLADFQYKVLHHPASWKNKLSIKKNPLYWIRIKNRYY